MFAWPLWIYAGAYVPNPRRPTGPPGGYAYPSRLFGGFAYSALGAAYRWGPPLSLAPIWAQYKRTHPYRIRMTNRPIGRPPAAATPYQKRYTFRLMSTRNRIANIGKSPIHS